MNRYERLLDEASKEDLYVIENACFESSSAGLINGNVIGLNREIKTTTEKACVLAEELGHHYTTVGNITNTDNAYNAKQERQARLNGFDRMVGLMGIVRAFQAGKHSLHEAAEYLEVTEEYLRECIKCYTDKYGASTTIGEYYVMFIPYLSVGKLL